MATRFLLGLRHQLGPHRRVFIVILLRKYINGEFFYGSETPEQVFNFLDRVDELRHARGASKQDLFLSAIDIFTGNALVWFRSIKNTVDTWDDLFEIFRNEFLPSHLDFDVWEKIRNYKQDFSEVYNLYSYYVEYVLSFAKIAF